MLDSFYRAFVAEQRYLLYLDGLKVTILVSVIAILIGVALGTILALMRLTAEQKGKSTLLSKIAYVQEFRRLIRDRWKVDVLLDYPMYRQ